MKFIKPDTTTAPRPPNGVRARWAIVAAITISTAACGTDTSTDPATSSDTANSTTSTPTPPSDNATPPTVAPSTTATTELNATTAMTEEPPAAPTPECRRLTDFDDDIGWDIVNDGVMGGGSAGNVEFVDSALRFTGEVVTAGGGFTSVRLPLNNNELAGSDHVELRVRSDGRTYGLTLEDDARSGGRSVSHRADLTIDGPSDADGWSRVRLRYDELRPSVFGRAVDAPPFNPDDAREFGIIIADGVDGAFALEVDWIDACQSPS